MEEIKELLNYDINIQNEIENIHSQKEDIKSKIKIIEKELYDKAWEEVKIRINKTKQELDANISKNKLDYENNLKEGLKELEETFNSNKDLWLKEIVDRCLK